jgi:hypothetical protein
MTAIRDRSDFQWLLWLVTATAALSGLWLAPITLGLTDRPEPTGLGIWIAGAAAWIIFIAGLAGWALLSFDGPVRQRLARAGAILCADFVALVVVGFSTGIIEMANRFCSPGSDANAPASIAWLAPVAVYYAIGYYGFTRPRRLWLIWPLAIACALASLLVVGWIWTTGSGCGD